MLFADLTLQSVAMRIAALLLIAAVQGYSLAQTANLLGDRGPRYDGRRRINPLVHLDLLGGLLVVLFGLGWTRPMVIDPRVKSRGRLVIVLAGAAATLAVSTVLELMRPLLLHGLADTTAAAFFVLVETVGQVCVGFALFNLIPLPPLTAGMLVRWPSSGAWRLGMTGAACVLAVAFGSGMATSAVSRIFG